MLPITDHDIIFPGKVGTGNHFRIAEAQALWAVVVLGGVTISERPSGRAAKEGMEKVVAKTVAWCRRRYLAKWEAGNWFYWGAVPYLLHDDLGSRSHGRGSW
jgi:dimethylaniline monooxygenase (N-oxide forming)